MRKKFLYPFVPAIIFSSMMLLLPLISFSCYKKYASDQPVEDGTIDIPAEAAIISQDQILAEAAPIQEVPETEIPEKTSESEEVKTIPKEPLKRVDFSKTTNKQLKKLGSYQDTIEGFSSNQLMVFINMPQTNASIQSTAQHIAQTSNEFATYNITPLFIIEPTTEKGALLNFKKIARGDYRKNIDKLFAAIKKTGISEKNLGIFVPYPEANTSAWDRKGSSPEEFPGMVNDFFETAKKYYPGIQGSVLLDTKTYPTNDTEWARGETKSFSPYITGIKAEHVQSFGLQGFPWVDENMRSKNYDAHDFLPTPIATEAAAILKTNTVWFNTGSFREMYSIGKTPVSAVEREHTLNTILEQATTLKSQGLNVWINLFAENKMSVDERTDWSYLDAVKNQTLSEHETVLKQFIDGMHAAKISYSLFDQ